LNIAFPQAHQKVEMVFSEIENALIKEEIDLGLIIHENRFTYAAKGLHKVIDLGSFWEQKTGSAIPLGGIVMSRKYDKQTLDKVNRIMASSVEKPIIFCRICETTCPRNGRIGDGKTYTTLCQ
jgi:1,4-dihydroxy-6-naphthoate synthase